MAELNFGLLTPPGSQSIGNAFVQGMDQAAVARAQENQNALAQYTLGKAKREDELTNKMLAGMQSATTLEQQAAVLRSVGKFREANELIAAGLDRQIKLGTLNAQPGAAARVAAQTARDRQQWEGQALRDLGNNPSDDHIRALGQDAVRKEIYTQDQADQKVAEFLAVPLADRAAKFKQYGAPARAPEATPPDILAMQQLGYPPTQEGYAAFRAAQRPKQLLTPDEEAQRVRIALASRPLPAPRAEAAPTITQIVDPSNPNQMITIDARRYTGGGSGSAGVIGVSGKEPSAALRENKTEAGRTLLADEISNVRNSLNILNANRAIPSTERGSLSNIGSSIAASGVGQLTGRMVGTEAQTERDLIASSKLRLSNAIKQASGMTAAQLNSNVELQTMLNSISNPAQSIETNLRNLDNIEKAYVNVTPPVRPNTPAGAPSSAQPTSGFLVTAPNKNVYKFTTQAEADAFKNSAGIK